MTNETSGDWQRDVRTLLAQGQKIEAIKLVRGQTNCGLKDAKEFVEALERGETPPVPLPGVVKQTSGIGCTVAFLIGLAAAIALFYLRH